MARYNSVSVFISSSIYVDSNTIRYYNAYLFLFFSQTAMLPPYSMCESFLPYLSPSPFFQFHVNSDLNLFESTGATEKRNSDIAAGTKDANKATEDGENEVDTNGRVAGVKVCTLDS